MKVIDPNQSYTFSKFFDMKLSAKDLAESWDYSLIRKRLNLPQYQDNLDRLEDLKNRIEEVIPYFELGNETSRREVLISPIILDLVHYTKCEVRIEYAIKVTEQLQGYLDYLIAKNKNFLVIEAKKGDLDYGMTQLIAELIALDKWEENDTQTEIIGAVTTGKIWEFARLNRLEKYIEQGFDSYRVPDDLESLMRILVQIIN